MLKNLVFPFFQTIFQLVRQNLQLEFRSKQTLFSSFLFLLLVFFIFSFSFPLDPETLFELAPGMLWVTITFSGTIVISRLTQKDVEDATQEGLLLTGCNGVSFFLAKWMTAFLFLCGLEILTLFVFALFLNFSFGPRWFLFSMVLVLGTAGFSSVGIFFSTLLSQVRFRDLLLPVLFYPVITPLLIAAVQATSSVLTGRVPTEIPFMVGFDLVLLAACALLFDWILEDPS